MNQIKEIENLIPHRAPFLFLDEITSVDLQTISGNRTFDRIELAPHDHLDDFNYVPGTILLESMVQCGGAGVKKMGLTEGLFGLAHIEKADFIGQVPFGEKVTYKVNNFKVTGKYVKQSGQAFVDGKMILEATWLCVKLE